MKEIKFSVINLNTPIGEASYNEILDNLTKDIKNFEVKYIGSAHGNNSSVYNYQCEYFFVIEYEEPKELTIDDIWRAN